MRKLLLFFLVVSFSLHAKDDPKYPVSAIPEDMKTGMYAVIRELDYKIEIKSVRSTSFYYHMAVTILNPNGKRLAKENIFYDNLRSIKSLKAIAYDAAGNVIKRLKQNEIKDESAFDGFSLYSDSRIKRIDLTQPEYPYTVEIDYEIDLSLYDLTDFSYYDSEEVSTQKSSFEIHYPPGLEPRYKLFKIPEPKRFEVNGNQVLHWSFENIKPEKFEPLRPDKLERVPNIKVAPNQFEYGGYTGNMASWNEYGKWSLLLNEGRDQLSEATKQKVRELTKNLKTIEEKTRVLYEYLQSKTRYVSIQLGIGGYQPFPASTVDLNGYGDCKALSNYMVAILKEVGIKGYYTTVMAGPEAPAVDANFPSDQSNHIIVAVPNGSDTLWLECTDQNGPFNYQGSFTGDRKALMITENGGVLVNTHRYPAEVNIQSRTAEVFVDLTGNAKARITTTYSGLQYENDNLNFILNNHPDDQKKWLQQNTDIPSFDINTFSMVNHKDKIPSAVVKIDLTLNRLATVNGKRLFLTANLMNRSTFIPAKLETRKSNVVLRSAYTDFDTIRYHIPDQIYPEFLPEPTKIKSKFGEYEASYKIDQGTLIYFRRMKMWRGEYPPEAYKELTDFFKSVNKADNTKIVFLNKT